MFNFKKYMSLSNIKFYLRNKVKTSGDNQISLGENTRVRYCQIEIRGHSNQLMIDDGANLKNVSIEIFGNHCSIHIGKNTVIGENCYISAKETQTSVSIGENCMFSRNVNVMTSDGHDLYQEDGKRFNQAENITIGEHVWLCDGVTLLKGANIGAHSVVGLKSLVTKAMPENSLIVGIPARVVKSNIQWDEKLTF